MGAGARFGLAAALALGASLALMPPASAQYDPAPRIDVPNERSAARRPITLPRGVVEAASAYAGYQRRAVAIDASFRDSEAINRAMVVGETYQPEQMQEGLIAYTALIALDDPTFVSGVQSTVRGAEGAEREADALLADPRAVALIPGSGEAAALAGAILRDEGGRLYAAGQAVKQSAYSIQHQLWSRQLAPNQPARLAKAKLLSASAVIPAPEEVSGLLQSAASFRSHRADAAPQLTPTIARGMALAALAVLGEANDERRLSSLWAQPETYGCMHSAKLNLYQCLAVAGPHYENVFCLGQHAMMDTGQCIAAAGGVEPTSYSTAQADTR